jgi:hypothetical protein
VSRRGFTKGSKDVLCVPAPVDELNHVLATLRHQQKRLAAMGVKDMAGRDLVLLVEVLLARPRRVERFEVLVRA